MRKALFALAILLAAVFSFAAIGEEAPVYTSGDYKYSLNADGSAVITKYHGEDAVLEIPAELDGHRVTGLGDHAFYNCNSLTSVTIPDSVTSIGGYAFGSCISLTSVTIPDSVTSIGGYAFYGCESLTSITIPESVTDIGANPFAECKKLTSIVVSPRHPTIAVIDGVLYSKPDKQLVCYIQSLAAENFIIPQGIQIIGDSAFYGCKSLTSITIPDSVTSIGNYAFQDCYGLTSMTIPDSVTSIGGNAFYYCESLTSITIPGSVTSIGKSAFYGCESLTSITIPGSVTSIGKSAFYSCESLTSITIPGSVTTIGKNAFSDCPSLTLTVPRDSYAEQYCIDNQLTYQFPDSFDWLNSEPTPEPTEAPAFDLSDFFT